MGGQPVRSLSHPASERYSVTLVPPAVQAVAELTEATGLSKADVINRAVQIYAYLEAQRAQGREILLRDPQGVLERVHIV
ncbi:hypothetical protein GCM10010372_72520 [Streptomyces tauricus]|uniref:hypothetical protein n=1 Tax=Streptomyces tauricus TaxID=68274 RepID=UPI001676A82E|nr:hypothetical protein [Streptomyces tauricus]MCW8100107.1 hypothetical protein [Streptomyces tauricus]GHA62243.1 hypothetical protein GCM10010372_72520 [Streptomyces tauricus]